MIPVSQTGQCAVLERSASRWAESEFVGYLQVNGCGKRQDLMNELASCPLQLHSPVVPALQPAAGQQPLVHERQVQVQI